MAEIEIQGEESSSEASLRLGKEEEKAVIGLAFAQPDFFSIIMPYLKEEFFTQYTTRILYAIINFHHRTHDVIVPRALCRDIVMKELSADDNYREVLELVDKELDPRIIPVVMSDLTDWAKKQAIGQIYSKEVMEAYERGDTSKIEEIIEESQKIVCLDNQSHFFFDEINTLFVPETDDRFTTSFPLLDRVMAGGPARGEVFCWMAPTGKGKSIALGNVGAANIKRNANVLHVTLEMTWKQTAVRYMANLSSIPMKLRFNPVAQEQIVKRLEQVRSTYNSSLIIEEFPPDEVSVDAISAKIDNLRKVHGIRIDVVIIDYIECLLSRNAHYNKDEYLRQKRVSTEIDRLAKKQKVAVFTATQTRRSGNEQSEQPKRGSDSAEGRLINIMQVAESYGKTMPLHYIVTINQTNDEYERGREGTGDQAPVTKACCRLYVVKNRNGRQNLQVTAKINYETMFMYEEHFPSASRNSDITELP